MTRLRERSVILALVLLLAVCVAGEVLAGRRDRQLGGLRRRVDVAGRGRARPIAALGDTGRSWEDDLVETSARLAVTMLLREKPARRLAVLAS